MPTDPIRRPVAPLPAAVREALERDVEAHAARPRRPEPAPDPVAAVADEIRAELAARQA